MSPVHCFWLTADSPDSLFPDQYTSPLQICYSSLIYCRVRGLAETSQQPINHTNPPDTTSSLLCLHPPHILINHWPFDLIVKSHYPRQALWYNWPVGQNLTVWVYYTFVSKIELVLTYVDPVSGNNGIVISAAAEYVQYVA